MSALPSIDYAATWARLTPDQQATAGALAIEVAFLMHASGIFEGRVVYLDAGGRDQAEADAELARDRLHFLIESAFPDLFGEFPSFEHPQGTDPDWATPMISEPIVRVVVERTA